MAAQSKRQEMDIGSIIGPIEITSLGAGGDGLADDIAVPQTLPSEIIHNGQITRPATSRITPPCPHFGACGGCVIQHANDPFIADWKRGIVAQALRAQGLPDAVAGFHVSPPATRRRTVMSGRRTKKTVQLGYFARRSDMLVPIHECHVLHPDIIAGFDDLKGVVRLAASRNSVVKLTVTTSGGGLDVAVANARELDGEEMRRLAEISRPFARIAWNGETVLQNAAPFQVFGPAEVIPPPGAFLQATKDGETALVDAVIRGIGHASSVLDAFCGCGTFTLPLATGAAVHGVEFEPAMVKALDAGWRQAQGVKRVTTEARDLFRNPLHTSELKPFDAVVLDPPRAGAAAQVEQIAASDIARVVHVSCNPVTFAREARSLMDAGFALDPVDVVDQFRWSSHVELVGTFSR